MARGVPLPISGRELRTELLGSRIHGKEVEEKRRRKKIIAQRRFRTGQGLSSGDTRTTQKERERITEKKYS